jgi:hypothetical protein
MGWDEIGYVFDALKLERNAFFLRGVAAKKLAEASKASAPIQNALEIAMNRTAHAAFLEAAYTKFESEPDYLDNLADKLKYSKRPGEQRDISIRRDITSAMARLRQSMDSCPDDAIDVEIARLKSELATAEEQKETVSKECVVYGRLADNCIKKAQKLRKEALDVRAQRLDYHIKLNVAARKVIHKRCDGQKYDLERVGKLKPTWWNRQVLAGIKTRGTYAFVIAKEMRCRELIEKAFNSCITGFFNLLKSKGNITDGVFADVDLRGILQEGYHCNARGYDSSAFSFLGQQTTDLSNFLNSSQDLMKKVQLADYRFHPCFSRYFSSKVVLETRDSSDSFGEEPEIQNAHGDGDNFDYEADGDIFEPLV